MMFLASKQKFIADYQSKSDLNVYFDLFSSS